MSWATHYIELLKQGVTVSFKPRGNSMQPKINSGDMVTLEPISDDTVLRPGDIVLCKVGGRQYLHLIKAMRNPQSPQYQIGNNKGGVNGWTSRSNIYGKCIRIDR